MLCWQADVDGSGDLCIAEYTKMLTASLSSVGQSPQLTLRRMRVVNQPSTRPMSDVFFPRRQPLTPPSEVGDAGEAGKIEGHEEHIAESFKGQALPRPG